MSASDQLLRQFAFFSANLQHLLPSIDFDQHAYLFKSLLSRRSDQSMNRLMKCHFNGFPGHDLDKHLLSAPSIFATFHYGNYTLLPAMLLHSRVPFSVLISTDVAKEQREKYEQIQLKLQGKIDSDLFSLIIAESPTVLFQMKEAIKDNKHIVTYMDGNMGSVSRQGDKNTLRLKFLNQELRVRTGIAHLAFMLACPIHLAIMANNADSQNPFVFYKRLMPAKKCTRLEYVNETVSHIYSLFSKVLERDPVGWEGWLYVHFDLVISDEKKLKLFFKHYIPFSIGQNYFLLEKDTFDSIPIDRPAYRKLKAEMLNYVGI